MEETVTIQRPSHGVNVDGHKNCFYTWETVIENIDKVYENKGEQMRSIEVAQNRLGAVIM